MKDKGLVVSSSGDLAKVAVSCLVSSCQGCSARNLCGGKEKDQGILMARNPVQAVPGDKVLLEIPDQSYNKAIISLFGGLLLASVAGAGVGYLVGHIFSIPPSGISLAGLCFFLAASGLWFGHRFRKKNRDLFPVIIDISSKGASHG